MSAIELLELLRARERERGPLFIVHSEDTQSTRDEAVGTALRAGRPVFNVRFVKTDGNGQLACGHPQGSESV